MGPGDEQRNQDSSLACGRRTVAVTAAYPSWEDWETSHSEDDRAWFGLVHSEMPAGHPDEGDVGWMGGLYEPRFQGRGPSCR